MKFGHKLRIERKKFKLSSHALGLKCGVSRSYITLMENCKRLPGKSIIPKLAVALNLETKVVINWYLEELKEKLDGNDNT